MMGAEIVELVHGPSLADILRLDEDARPLPLDIYECIYHRTIVVLDFLLVVEGGQGRVPCRGLVFCVVPGVCSDLHLHHVFRYVKLQIELCVDGCCGYGNDILVG